MSHFGSASLVASRLKWDRVMRPRAKWKGAPMKMVDDLGREVRQCRNCGYNMVRVERRSETCVNPEPYWVCEDFPLCYYIEQDSVEPLHQ